MMGQSQCMVKFCQNVSNLNKGNLEKRDRNLGRNIEVNVIWKQAKVEWNKVDHGVEHVYLLK